MFLHLPPEIRAQIYKLLFTDVVVNGADPPAYLTPKEAVSLFLVCRQIAIEAPHYLYSRTFIFQQDIKETPWQRAYRFLIRLDDRYRQLIHLRIHFPDHVLKRRYLAVSANTEIKILGGHRSERDEFVDEWIVDVFKLRPASIQLFPHQGWLPGVRVLEAKTWSTALPELMELYKKTYSPSTEMTWYAQDWREASQVGWQGTNGVYKWAP